MEKCRKCRRSGQKLFLKGEKCLTPKCSFTRRSYAPGEHGARGRFRLSEFAIQLQEKQKMKHIYNIPERQLSKYYRIATQKIGKTSDFFLQLVEIRLDNVLYRAGLAKSRRHAKKLITDKFVLVNNQKINQPSCQIKASDEISINKKLNENPIFIEVVKDLKKRKIPSWIKLDAKILKIKIDHLPKRDEIDIPIDESQILEYYSRK